MKEELVVKENDIIHEDKKVGDYSKYRDLLADTVQKLKDKKKVLQDNIGEKDNQLYRLKRIYTEIEQEMAKQQKELSLITKERDILGT